MPEGHSVEDALRRLVGDPEPNERQRQLGEERLRRLIEKEPLGAHRPLLRRRVALAVVTAVALIFGIWFRPSPSEAATERIAAVIETVDPLTLLPNEYLYTRANVSLLAIVPADALGNVAFSRSHLVYLLSSIREAWIASDGSMQLRTTNLRPHFFSREAELAYFEARLDRNDQLEAPHTESFARPENPSFWPDDIDALDEAIRSEIQEEGNPGRVQYLYIALGILRERLVSPQLRANVIRLIGRLPSIAVEESGDALVVSTTYTDQNIRTRLAFSIDASGNLAREEVTILEANALLDIPADTSTFLATYEQIELVPDLTTP